MAKKTRKKPRSRKQKAATRKLVARNKAKGRKKRKTRRKSTSKRRSPTKRRKTNKTKPKKKSVAGKGKKSLIDKVPILKNKTVQRIAFGLGIGLVAVKIIDLAAQFGPPALTAPLVANKRIIQLGVEAVTEPISAVVDVVTGGGINLGSLTAGRSQQVSNGNGNGFA